MAKTLGEANAFGSIIHCKGKSVKYHTNHVGGHLNMVRKYYGHTAHVNGIAGCTGCYVGAEFGREATAFARFTC